MAAKKVGNLIKQARTDAGFTQEKLAKLIPGLSASDISAAERGEKTLTQDQLKAIAKATGVTQKSLLEAAGSSKTAAKTSASSSGTSMKVSATEKRLVELYRNADGDTKKKVMSLLKGDAGEGSELISSLLSGALGQMLKK